MPAVAEQVRVPELRFPEFVAPWRICRLTEYFSISRGRFSPRPRNNPIYYDGDFPFVQTSEVVQSGGYLGSTTQSLNEQGLAVSRLFPAGTILMTIAANIGYVAELQCPMACPDSLVGLTTPKDGISRFSLIGLSRLQKSLEYIAPEAAQKNLSLAELSSVKFSVPAGMEQEKIAGFLTAVDERIGKLKRKKELLEEYKRGMMQKLFSQEVRFKDEHGRHYPDWKQVKLSQLLEIKITDGPHSTPEFLSKGIPFLSVNNIVDNRLDFRNVRHVSEADHHEFSKKCKPEKGDILLGKAASVGKVAIVDTLREFNIWSPLACIRMNAFQCAHFFYYSFLTHRVQRSLWRLVNASSQPNIGMGDIVRVRFLVPSRHEQERIAEFLTGLDEKLANLGQRIEKAEEFKRGLLQKMFV